MRRYKFCPDKQQYNIAKPFAYVVVEEVEKYYECFKYGGISFTYIRMLYSFGLFANMYMNFYFITTN